MPGTTCPRMLMARGAIDAILPIGKDDPGILIAEDWAQLAIADFIITVGEWLPCRAQPPPGVAYAVPPRVWDRKKRTISAEASGPTLSV